MRYNEYGYTDSERIVCECECECEDEQGVCVGGRSCVLLGFGIQGERVEVDWELDIKANNGSR